MAVIRFDFCSEMSKAVVILLAVVAAVAGVKSDAFERKINDFDALLGESAWIYENTVDALMGVHNKLSNRDFLASVAPESLKEILKQKQLMEVQMGVLGSMLLTMGDGVETDYDNSQGLSKISIFSVLPPLISFPS